MTVVFSEDVHVLLNYKVSSLSICVWVCTHPLRMPAFIQALLKGMCDDELVC